MRITFGFIIALISSIDSYAEPINIDFFGTRVEIREGSVEQYLYLQENEVHKDWRIDLEEIGILSGRPYIIGRSSAGGNACEARPFVLSVNDRGNPQFDGPLSTCSVVTWVVEAGAILFREPEGYGRPGEVWNWRPATGFTRLGEVAFSPDPARGWDIVRERSLSHPGDLLSLGEIRAQLDALLGEHAASIYESLSNGIGSGAFEGSYFVGAVNCNRRCNPEVGTLVVLDTVAKEIFVATRPVGGEVRSFPAGEWPGRASAALANWQR